MNLMCSLQKALSFTMMTLLYFDIYRRKGYMLFECVCCLSKHRRDIFFNLINKNTMCCILRFLCEYWICIHPYNQW